MATASPANQRLGLRATANTPVANIHSATARAVSCLSRPIRPAATLPTTPPAIKHTWRAAKAVGPLDDNAYAAGSSDGFSIPTNKAVVIATSNSGGTPG